MSEPIYNALGESNFCFAWKQLLGSLVGTRAPVRVCMCDHMPAISFESRVKAGDGVHSWSQYNKSLLRRHISVYVVTFCPHWIIPSRQINFCCDSDHPPVSANLSLQSFASDFHIGDRRVRLCACVCKTAFASGLLDSIMCGILQTSSLIDCFNVTQHVLLHVWVF